MYQHVLFAAEYMYQHVLFAAEYMYQRARLNTENELVGGTPLSTLSSFIPEEAADLSDLPNDVCEDDLFQMDDGQYALSHNFPTQKF